MLTEDNLLQSLEFITEGKHASLPARLSRETFSTQSFKKEAESICKKSKPWTRGAGIQGIGIGEKMTEGQSTGELALRVYVERKKPNNKLSNPVPSRVEVPEVGVCNTDVLEIGRVQKEMFTERQRPAAPGCGLGHFKVTVGTFGCLVRKRGSQRGVYILSNSHVLANEGLAAVGDAIIQPGDHDNGRRSTDSLAELSEWIPFDFSQAGFPNLVDAAIAKVKKRSVSEVVRIIGTPITGVSKTLRRGMRVRKIGRTTDYTTGEITDINYRLPLKYSKPGGGNGVARFKDQVLCTRYTAGGDSGAAVLNSRGRIVGLHFAGSVSSSIFNRIGHVFYLLDIELA